jgi:hypothetical protein
MVTLDLNEDEKQVLIDLLDDCLTDLRMEICDTDNIVYKQNLKNRKAVIRKIIAELQRAVEPIA